MTQKSPNPNKLKVHSAKQWSKTRIVLFILFIVLLLGLLEAIFFYTMWGDDAPATGKQDSFVPEAQLQEILQTTDVTADCQAYFSTDSDNDLLADNLEKKFGTNIASNDTDQDGSSDRKEIEAGENPLGTDITTLAGQSQEDWVLYNNEQYKYSLRVPSSWRVEATQESQQINFYTAEQKNDEPPQLRVFFYKNEKELELEELLVSWYVEAQVLTSIQVDGQPAQKTENGAETRVLLPRGKQVISITYFTDKEIGEGVINSFQLTEQTP